MLLRLLLRATPWLILDLLRGYLPSYKVDWSDYRKYKSSGGSFKDYSKKEYQPLTEDALIRHLQGIDTIGVYPLLEDNTSYFIAADFDDNNWKESILKLYSVCSGTRFLHTSNDPVQATEGISGSFLKKISRQRRPESFCMSY